LDSNVKHYIRNEYIITPIAIKSQIPKNKQAQMGTRKDDKYVAVKWLLIKKRIELIKGTGDLEMPKVVEVFQTT
jgi:hypothetical protein